MRLKLQDPFALRCVAREHATTGKDQEEEEKHKLSLQQLATKLSPAQRLSIT